MAAGKRVIDARTHLAELRAREKFWLYQISSLAVAPAGGGKSKLDIYKDDYRAKLKDKTETRQESKDALKLDQKIAGLESGLATKLRGKKMVPETNLAKLYRTVDAAKSTMSSIEGKLPSFTTSRVGADRDFFKNIDKALTKGNYTDALTLVRAKQPGAWASRPAWLGGLGKSGVRAWKSDLIALETKIQDHQKARETVKANEKTVSTVEKATATAFKKLIKENRKFIASNPELVSLATTNPTVALLIKHAGSSGKISYNNILKDLRAPPRSTSLTDAHSALHFVQGKLASDYQAAKTVFAEAEVKKEDCEHFIAGCRKAMKYETHITGKDGKLVDLQKLLADFDANPKSLSNRELDELLEKVRNRQATSTTAADQRIIKYDTFELLKTATCQHAKLDFSVLPDFHVAARVYQDPIKHVAKPVLDTTIDIVKKAYHAFVP